MQMYLTAFQWGDYKWQVLSRLLLLYQTLKNSMDLETINKMLLYLMIQKINK